MINLRSYFSRLRFKYLVDHNPRAAIDKIWMRKYGYTVDWDTPRDLNEKIEWLICYGDTSGWPALADKVTVRDYVRRKGYERLLPQVLGVWNHAHAIDFDALPDRFVLKCTHDCESIRFIDKTQHFDPKGVIQHFDTCLKKKYGHRYCEPHYNKIKPRVIAEEFLQPDNPLSSSLIDYKVWCFEGKADFVFVCHNREKDHLSVNVYDLDWNVHPEYSVFSPKYRDGQGKIPRPEHLAEMIETAETLSKGLHEARIDFYETNGKLYFGEITLTSCSGRMEYFTKDYLIELGNKIILP